MTHGIDTDFLVAVEIREHPFHRQADALLGSLLSGGHDFERISHGGHLWKSLDVTREGGSGLVLNPDCRHGHAAPANTATENLRK